MWCGEQGSGWRRLVAWYERGGMGGIFYGRNGGAEVVVASCLQTADAQRARRASWAGPSIVDVRRVRR